MKINAKKASDALKERLTLQRAAELTIAFEWFMLDKFDDETAGLALVADTSGRSDQWHVTWFQHPKEHGEASLRRAVALLRQRIGDDPVKARDRMQVPTGCDFALLREMDGVQMRLIVTDIPVTMTVDPISRPLWGEVKPHYWINVDEMRNTEVAPCHRLDVRFLDPSIIKDSA